MTTGEIITNLQQCFHACRVYDVAVEAMTRAPTKQAAAEKAAALVVLYKSAKRTRAVLDFFVKEFQKARDDANDPDGGHSADFEDPGLGDAPRDPDIGAEDEEDEDE